MLSGSEINSISISGSLKHGHLVNKLVRLEQRIGEGPSSGARAPGKGLPLQGGGRGVGVAKGGGAVERREGAVVLLLMLAEEDRGGEGLLPDHRRVIELVIAGRSDPGPAVAGCCGGRIGESLDGPGPLLRGSGGEAGAEIAHYYGWGCM